MKRWIGVLVMAGMLVSAATGAQSKSPSQQAYDAVSVFRDRHGDVIWGDEKATPEQLRAVLADLHHGLDMLDAPLDHDLAEGNRYLRYRRSNFLMDVVKVEARLGDTDAMFNAWTQLQDLAWTADIDALLLKDPDVARYAGDPRLAVLRQHSALAGRLFKLPASEAYSEHLTTEQRIAGLSALWIEARNGFVWFDHVPGLDWDKTYLDYLPQVVAATSTADYYKVLTRFIALLHDGHSNVYFPDALDKQFYSRPPLRTGLVEGKVLVLAISSATLRAKGLAVGDEIDAIDGAPVQRYAAEHVAPYVSSSTPQDRDVRIYGYELLLGAADTPVTLGLVHPDGTRQDIRVDRGGYADIEEKPSESFNLRKDGVAVLAVGQLENDAARKLLDAHLDELLRAKALILDLRGNGGGSSNYGFAVLSYLDSKPIPAMRSRYRTSDPIVRAQSGDFAQLEWRNLGNDPFVLAHAHVFDRPVAMLIDARTFSAGEDTAASFKLMHRGAIIGTRSGGSTGQPLGIGLPGGGTARICVKRDEYPDGSTFVGTGVVPDSEIQPSIADLRAGRDTAMERASEWLSRQGTKK
jgi:C-terminal processing protease CtpA/Prc